MDIFSPESIKRGSFDKYVEAKKAKKGTAEVDNVFLQEIERWRDLLARNFALRNSLTQRQLNFAVQQTIDRLIFLRIAEDRGIERYGRLQELVKVDNLYPRLFEIFQKADEKYNSGLFHFHAEKGRDNPDTLTPALTLDDKVLKDILRHLYYPDSPYEFSVLPSDILGQVYEQFLGKVIRLTAKGQAKIEDKPEVKKAGGVFYTPTYIVDYIVRQTVGQLVEGKTPGQLSGKNPLRVLDPACGSGSFLLGAYQFLLDWYLNWYTNNDPDKQAQKKNAPIYPAPTTDPAIPNWQLTVNERKRILLTHIFGVDIDPQAVEVTKLSLLLKVLEDEQSVTKQLGLFQERVLPDLDQNIKCGNSLIGWDFYNGQQMGLGIFDEDEQYRINAFDWQAEFAEVMQAGGFDAVIGNPPWGASYTKEEKDYLRKRFNTIHVRTPESFNYFMAQFWKNLKQTGIMGVIIPSSFLLQYEFWKSRQFLIENGSIGRICNLGDGVFQGVTAPSCILVFERGHHYQKSLYLDLRNVDRVSLQIALFDEKNSKDASRIGQESDDYSFQIREHLGLIKKCYTWPTLKSIAEDVATGISSGRDKAYVYTKNEIAQLSLEQDLLRKLIIGGEICRYALTPKSNKFIIYATPDTNIKKYPITESILMPHREHLMKRREAANGKIPWYSLNWPRRTKLFEKPKILIRQTANRILAAYDTNNWYCLKSAIIIQLPEVSNLTHQYLLALLNSKLIHFLYVDLVGEEYRVFPEVKPVQLFRLPIRIINFDDPTDKANHDKMVSLVEQMLTLNQQLNQPQTPQAKTMLQRQVEATDRQIDKLVYELYGLTDEEIRIVEGQ